MKRYIIVSLLLFYSFFTSGQTFELNTTLDNKLKKYQINKFYVKSESNNDNGGILCYRVYNASAISSPMQGVWIEVGTVLFTNLWSYFSTGKVTIKRQGHNYIYINGDLYGFQDEIVVSIPTDTNIQYLLAKPNSSNWQGMYNARVDNFWQNKEIVHN